MRFGRVPKREKAKILAAMQSVNARSQERAVLAELEDNTRVTAAIIRAHMDTCDFTRDKVAPMLQQARAHPSYTQCPPTLVSVLTTLFGVLGCYGEIASGKRVIINKSEFWVVLSL